MYCVNYSLSIHRTCKFLIIPPSAINLLKVVCSDRDIMTFIFQVSS